MRERLIELYHNIEIEYLDYLTNIAERALEDDIEDKIQKRQEFYVDKLLANGVIVPPCKVGDKVYRAVKLVNGKAFVVDGIMFEVASTYEAGTVKTRFYFWANGDEYTRRHYSLWCELTEFGKTVFLTKEEAENALSKLPASYKQVRKEDEGK